MPRHHFSLPSGRFHHPVLPEEHGPVWGWSLWSACLWSCSTWFEKVVFFPSLSSRRSAVAASSGSCPQAAARWALGAWPGTQAPGSVGELELSHWPVVQPITVTATFLWVGASTSHTHSASCRSKPRTPCPLPKAEPMGEDLSVVLLEGVVAISRGWTRHQH